MEQTNKTSSLTTEEINWEQGSAGASSEFESAHNANRAFVAQSAQSAQSAQTAPWANAESDKFPVMVLASSAFLVDTREFLITHIFLFSILRIF